MRSTIEVEAFIVRPLEAPVVAALVMPAVLPTPMASVLPTASVRLRGVQIAMLFALSRVEMPR